MFIKLSTDAQQQSPTNVAAETADDVKVTTFISFAPDHRYLKNIDCLCFV
jgi:hypothetical protein